MKVKYYNQKLSIFKNKTFIFVDFQILEREYFEIKEKFLAAMSCG